MTLKIDLHVHSSLSSDGRDSLEAMLAAAKERGLDGIALTDHDILSAYSDGDPFVIPGCECSTREGHILALFINKLPQCLKSVSGELPSASETIDEIHRLGGVAVWAHPYERSGRVDECAAEKCDLIESSNSRACFKNKLANIMASQLAERLSKPKTGGSDAHSKSEVGNSYTAIYCKDKSLDSIKSALLRGEVSPVLVKNTPRVNKGLSQLEKCRRQGAPLPRMLKAYAYIIYCVLADLIKR